MKQAIIVVGILALTLRMEPQTTEPPKDPAKASLEGSVVKEPGGEPIKKAIIEVIGNQGEGGNYTAVSDAEGRFKIADILPGRYRVLVERTGFIEVDKKNRRSQGTMLSVEAGQEVKGHTLHMLTAAIVMGRVLDEDGDPMANVDVTVLRRKGKSFEPNGSAQTNDLGEYRIGGLLAGRYYISATPLPNFQTIAMLGRAEGHDPAAPHTSYLRTFYPGVLDRAQATTVELRAGEETPVDFNLARRHAAAVRGRVLGLAPGTGGMVMLRSQEANSEFNTGEINKEGKFEILNVAPGKYTLIAITVTTEKPQIVREPIDVGTSDIEDVQLAPQPPASIRGRVRFPGKSAELKAASAIVFLHSLDGDDSLETGVTISGDETSGSPTFAKLKPDGVFELKNVPPGTYELSVTGDSQELRDTFIESVVAGSKDYVDTGLNVNGGTIVLDVTVVSGAGVIDGVVTSEKSEPVAGSEVVAIPSPPFRKQASRYARAETDQNGQFSMRGLRPGAYTLYAWETLEGDEYLDSDFLKPAEGQGKPVKVDKSSHQTVDLKVIPAAGEQP